MVLQTERKISLKPLSNRVIAERIEKEETLKGGIILPDSAKKKQETVKIIAVGPGTLTKEGVTLPMPVKVGDVVLVDKYANQEVTIDGEDYVIFKADDIIAIVTNS